MSPEEKELSIKALSVIWNVFYWAAFFLCWAVLPFMMSYVRSGEFTFQGRVRWAIRDNLKYYGLIALIGVTFLIYLWVNNAFQR